MKYFALVFCIGCPLSIVLLALLLKRLMEWLDEEDEPVGWGDR